jgi:hypothetical protein
MGRLFRNCRWQRIASVWLLWSLTSGVGSTLLINGSGLRSAALGAQEIQVRENEPTRALSPKQKRDLLKSNFEKMKRDADELAGLAQSLQDDVNKSSEHVLSLQIMEKAEKIEKLARRIKITARGY